MFAHINFLHDIINDTRQYMYIKFNITILYMYYAAKFKEKVIEYYIFH